MKCWLNFPVRHLVKIDWKIRSFAPDDAPAFAALNRRWIDEMFGIEEQDQHQLDQPEKTIIEPGGYIAIADANGWIVGTGAILPAAHPPNDGHGWMEVVKMATDPSAQGQRIGSAVLDRLIAVAQDQGARRIWLATHDSLQTATDLYRRRGFVELATDDTLETPYVRCNLQMVLTL